MRLALCHEWLGDRTGSEKTFEAMAVAAPEADLYALTWTPSAEFAFGGRRPTTTFLDRAPFIRGRRRLQLPLMPLAWRYATRRRYDVVVTSSHACAKGFWPARDALHLCYCYTPMRYVWLPEVDARTRPGGLTSVPRAALRAWDRRSAAWVDDFAAISGAVRERIERFYGRPARVIHPPVDTAYYTPSDAAPKGEFALVVSRFVRYKRIDVAIRACHALRYPLVVAGSGPEEGALRALATELGAPVRFVVSPSDHAVRELYRTARALVFPVLEDFGIVAVEAQACGTPVVGLAAGGSLETVRAGVTGVLVESDDVAAVRDGLERVLAAPPSAEACRRHAERFSADRFADEFRGWLASHMAVEAT